MPRREPRHHSFPFLLIRLLPLGHEPGEVFLSSPGGEFREWGRAKGFKEGVSIVRLRGGLGSFCQVVDFGERRDDGGELLAAIGFVLFKFVVVVAGFEFVALFGVVVAFVVVFVVEEFVAEGSIGLEGAELAEGPVIGALGACGVAADAVGLGFGGGVDEGVETAIGEFGFEEAAAALVPGGVDQVVEGKRFERAFGGELIGEVVKELVEVRLLAGLDDDLAGSETVGAGVAS